VSSAANPTHVIWWLVSRASGVIALLLISLSVVLGLVMAAKLPLKPGLKRSMVRLHEHVALTALLAIGAHGLSLLGDHWLKPGWRGIAIPFAMSYRPQFTGVGIIAGYLALLLGPSFYMRRRIGARRWRKLHRMTALVWLLSVLHTLGAGSDGSKLWLRCVVLVPAMPVVYLLVLRVLRDRSREPRHASSSTTGAARSEKPHGASAPTETALASKAVASMPRSGTVRAKNMRVPGTSSAKT
jgi:sulfoxide reductase heme-binding subunit YedZ